MPDADALQSMRDAVAVRAKERAPEPAPPPAPLTESMVLALERENYLGDAKLYVHLHRGTVVYVHLWEKWLTWSGHYWTLDINSHHSMAKVELVAREYLRVAGIFHSLLDKFKNPDLSESEEDVLTKQRDALLARAKRCRGKDRKAILEYVHTGASEPLSITGDELDKDPYLMACANGVIDLRTQEHRPGRPDDFITRASPTEWQGMEADAAPFLDFLLHILGDSEPLRDFMLRFLGMALLAGQREHVFLVLFGEGGRNGKDTLMNILMDVLGPELCSPVPPELFMEQKFVKDSSKSNPHLMALRGKRIVYASESSKNHRFNSEELKRQTGGGKESTRGLYENHMTEWERTHTVILLTNELPAAPPDDEAFWTRLHGIELKRRYINNPDPTKGNEFPQDPDLREKMRACRPGILAALVKGFGEYLRGGGLHPPPEVTSFGQAYRKSEDVVGLFLEDCCEVHDSDKEAPAHRTQAQILYECFVWWFTRNISRKALTAKNFAAALRKKEFESKKISVNYYLGISLTPDTQLEWEEDKKEKAKKFKGDDYNV